MPRLALLVFSSLLVLADCAFAQLIATQDGTRTLVNKDVNGERWAITYDPARASVTGNVLLPSGGVAFIDCGVGSTIGGQISLSCYEGKVDHWEYLAAVQLPESFLGLGGQGCQQRDMEYGYWFVSYADSCGNTGQAKVEFDQDGCRFSGISYEGDNVYVAGLQISGELTTTTEVQLRLDFFGACQGSAGGSGSIVRWTGGIVPDDGDSIQGTVRGTSSCCSGVEAQVGLRW